MERRRVIAEAECEFVVARARGGDLAAIETLYRSYGAKAYTVARRILGRPEDAEDATQETFLEVARSIGKFRADGSLEGWIRRIAASKALMRIRGEKGGAARDSLGERDVAAPEGGSANDRLDLGAALDRLAPSARAVIWLHDVEGYTHEEIGGMMGLTPSFSKSQLARGHARLRELLGG